MIIAIKIMLFLSLGGIFYGDFKERKVWNFLFIIFAICGGLLFFLNSNWEFFRITVFINTGVVAIVLLINYLLAKFVLKKNFLKEVMGLGDVLFFFGFALSFPTISFINFFVFSILFAFVFHFVLKNTSSFWHKNPPLAGCMSLFLIAVYTAKWLGLYESIYVL